MKITNNYERCLISDDLFSCSLSTDDDHYCRVYYIRKSITYTIII